MKRKYVIGLDGSGIDEALDGIEQYKKWLKERAEALVDKLASMGYDVAAAGFEAAVYDGARGQDSVSIEKRGETTRAVVALGPTALFIEFGTGVTYPDNHPEAAELGMIRGAYGQGKGKQRTWGFYGEAGSNGVPVRETSKGTLILTHGNPANMPMYNAVKALERDFEQAVREVFGSD